MRRGVVGVVRGGGRMMMISEVEGSDGRVERWAWSRGGVLICASSF